MRNLACQLIQHKRIVTTLAKAKALRVFVEPLLTKSKKDDTHQRRIVFSYLQDKEALKELFGTVSMKISDRRVDTAVSSKLERRLGDAADMAMIELVDFNEIYNPKTVVGEEKKKTRRSRAKKPAAAPVAAAAAAPEVVAPVVEETVAPVEEVVTEVTPEVAPETPAAESNETPENKTDDAPLA